MIINEYILKYFLKTGTIENFKTLRLNSVDPFCKY